MEAHCVPRVAVCRTPTCNHYANATRGNVCNACADVVENRTRQVKPEHRHNGGTVLSYHDAADHHNVSGCSKPAPLYGDFTKEKPRRRRTALVAATSIYRQFGELSLQSGTALKRWRGFWMTLSNKPLKLSLKVKHQLGAHALRWRTRPVHIPRKGRPSHFWTRLQVHNVWQC